VRAGGSTTTWKRRAHGTPPHVLRDLGNFSFGDYFKPDAIAFAYELLVKNLGIDASAWSHRPHTDDEASTLWKKIAGVDDSRVIRLGDKDNFWAMAKPARAPVQRDPLPPGRRPSPRRGRRRQRLPGPACDCDSLGSRSGTWSSCSRAVRGQDTQAAAQAVGHTAWDWERLCAVIGAFRSNYETDLIRPLIAEVEKLTGRPSRPPIHPQLDRGSMRAIADHARSAAFPDCRRRLPREDRARILLRRIMRRAIYHGWLLGIDKPFLPDWLAA